MADRAFNYLATMSTLMRDYAEARLNEIRAEAKALEAYLAGQPLPDYGQQEPAQRKSSVKPVEREPRERPSSLARKIEMVLREHGGEMRAQDIMDALKQDGWPFNSERHAFRAVTRSLSTNRHVTVRKSGPHKGSPVYFSMAAEPEMELPEHDMAEETEV